MLSLAFALIKKINFKKISAVFAALGPHLYS
jgi:hypothetical protein